MDNCRHVNRLRPARDHSILNPQKWLCGKCGTTESVWACLACPNVACGRYNEEHALQHFNETKHPVAIEVNDKYVFCYECDEYVLNDNAAGDLKLLRTTLRAITTQTFPHDLHARGRRLLRSNTYHGHEAKVNLQEEDRSYTAILFRRLTLLRRIFYAWRTLTEICRQKRTPVPAHPLPSTSPSTSQLSSPSCTPGGTRRKPTILPGVTGLKNLGNTCYMNSILQVLSHLQQFREGLLNLIPTSSPCTTPGASPVPSTTNQLSRKYMRQTTQECFEHVVTTPRKYGNVGGLNGGSTSQSSPIKQAVTSTNTSDHISLCKELHALFRVMWSGKWARVSPHAMLYSVWNLIPFFKGYSQQDAQEFLCELLDKIQMEAGGSSPLSNHPMLPILADMASLFQGELTSQVRCLACGHKSRRTEEFMDLSLEFPNRYQINNDGPSRVSYKSCHIEEMLAKFTEVEKLDGKIYACEKCNSKRRRNSDGATILTEAEKVILISRLPKILRLHLKRFRWAGRNHREKINVHVEFEEDLHIEGFCHPELNEQLAYRLSAVVMHHGRGFGSGHYTSYVWNEGAESWVHCNDARLEFCSIREVMKSQAYILFYTLVPSSPKDDDLATPLEGSHIEEEVDEEITFNYKNSSQIFLKRKRSPDSESHSPKFKLKRRRTMTW